MQRMLIQARAAWYLLACVLQMLRNMKPSRLFNLCLVALLFHCGCLSTTSIMVGIFGIYGYSPESKISQMSFQPHL